MKRDKCSLEEAQNKLKNQMPIEAKVAMAEVKIDNKGKEEDMPKQFAIQFMQYFN